jgi:hypothetical protein
VRLALTAIEDGVVRLASGEYRAVLEVAGTVGPLDDDLRQEAVLAGFAAFLNALSFPVQLVVRATPVDLGRYLATLEERAGQGLPGELAMLARDHASFVQGLARQRTLLERRAYVVIPAQAAPVDRWPSWLPARRRPADGPHREAARRQLTFRCEEIGRQLARCGLVARRLGDLELAQLYLACWSPERARAQRFRQRLDDYTLLAVRGPRDSRASAAQED